MVEEREWRKRKLEKKKIERKPQSKTNGCEKLQKTKLTFCKALAR